MKNFQFGEIRPHPSGKGTVGDFALHVQCPWRLVTTTQVLTGSADYYEPAVEGEDVNLDDHQSGNLSNGSACRRYFKPMMQKHAL